MRGLDLHSQGHARLDLEILQKTVAIAREFAPLGVLGEAFPSTYGSRHEEFLGISPAHIVVMGGSMPSIPTPCTWGISW